MNKPFKIILTIGLVLLALGFFKDQIIKYTVQFAATKVLGAPVHIDGMSVGIFKQSVRIKGLRVYNPAGFPKGVMLDITQVGVDYDLPAILSGKLHLPYLVLDLKEMTVLKNSNGQLNVDALKVAKKKEGGQGESKGGEAKDNKEMPMAIDAAVLNLGQVVVKDYTQDPPAVTSYNIGVRNKTFRNIRSAQQLAALVMVQGLGPTALRSAAMYGAASVLGVAFLPAGVAGVLMGNDSALHDFNSGFDRTFDAVVKVMGSGGRVDQQDREKGIISGVVQGANVTVELLRAGGGTHVKIGARKMMLPKPEVAEGLMHELKNTIK